MILPNRILFIGAHCDDIELIAGGLLARMCRARATVGVLTFSDHRGVVDEATAAAARREMIANMEWLSGESGTTIVDHTSSLLPACRGAFETERGALYSAMERLRDAYDCVVTHPLSDTNQDHRQVAIEAARVFKAHATVLGGEFPNNDLGDFRGEVVVALVESDVEAKARMVAAYRSQDFGGRPYLGADGVRSLARVRGAQIRTPFAEAFTVGARLIAR